MPRWWLAIHLLAADAFVPADVLHGPQVLPRGRTINIPALGPRRPSPIPANTLYGPQVLPRERAIHLPSLGPRRPSLVPASAKAADDDGFAVDKVYFDQMTAPIADVLKPFKDAMPTPEPGEFRGLRAIDVLSNWSDIAAQAQSQRDEEDVYRARRAVSAGEASHVYALTRAVRPAGTAELYTDTAMGDVLAIGVTRYACVGGNLCGLDITHVVAKPSENPSGRSDDEAELLRRIRTWTAKNNCMAMIQPPFAHASRRSWDRDYEEFYGSLGFFPMGGKLTGVYLGVADALRATEHSLVELAVDTPVTV